VKILRQCSKVTAAIAGSMAFLPSPVLACAACYGRSDSPLASGMNWGIFTLLGVVITVLVSIAGFFFYIIRRETAHATTPAPGQNLSAKI
jgi:hypothetical protein